MSKRTRTILLAVLVFLILLFLYQGVYGKRESRADEEKLFLVERGQGLFSVAKRLEKEDLIGHRAFFILYALLKGDQQNLKAGAYLLSRALSVSEIAEKFVSGKTATATVRIGEGWNMRDIAEYLQERIVLEQEEFFKVVEFHLPYGEGFKNQFAVLQDKPSNVGLEGYLFPDTYRIEYGESAEQIVRFLLKNFEKKLTPEIRGEITKQRKTIFEIVTMASMLEKEVRTGEEKRLVAGILWKRLEHGIPLQVDATVLYSTGKRSASISQDELEIDSPYNTRRYPGLPLGPISNPGMESILAALYPQASGYWYYLSSPGGQTFFSRTLEEHNIKKAKYLRRSN